MVLKTITIATRTFFTHCWSADYDLCHFLFRSLGEPHQEMVTFIPKNNRKKNYILIIILRMDNNVHPRTK